MRSGRSLIQIIGRAARNAEGKVILYADRITDSMRTAISETERRRAKQEAYNKEHGITPRSVFKKVSEGIRAMAEMDYVEVDVKARPATKEEIVKEVKKLTRQMLAYASELEFEQAARLRDEIKRLEERRLKL